MSRGAEQRRKKERWNVKKNWLINCDEGLNDTLQLQARDSPANVSHLKCNEKHFETLNARENIFNLCV